MTSLKHIIRDSFIWFVDAVGAAARYRVRQRQRGPLVRVIVFHDVANADWFRRVMQLLNDRYHVLTPGQFHQGQFDAERINVLITFDDGYQTWIDNCLPALADFRFRAIFFVNSGMLDVATDDEAAAAYVRKRLLITPKQPLTWEGASALLAAGHTIGGHTVSHPRLSSLELSAQRDEIVDDKAALEQQLGVTLQDFAYPFGRPSDRSDETQGQVTDAGYNFVYTTDAAFVDRDDHNAIPRLCLEKDQPVAQIARWIDGGYDIFSQAR